MRASSPGWLVVAACILSWSAPVLAANGSPLVRTKPATYEFTLGAEFRLTHSRGDYLDCNLPVAETDPYQDVELRVIDVGTIRKHPENGGLYLFTVLENWTQTYRGTFFRFLYTAKVMLYDVKTDFASLPSIPYRKANNLYRRYTAPNGKHIVPRNPRINRIADSLKARERDFVDFARKAYTYLTDSFAYRETEGTLDELEDILERNGGNSAELSSVYISLLRNRGIPARHVVGRRQDGALHVFAEFYVEGGGWIPVDVAGGISRPKTDYFGRRYGGDRLVVVSRDIMLTVSGFRGNRIVPFLGGYNQVSNVVLLPDELPPLFPSWKDWERYPDLFPGKKRPERRSYKLWVEEIFSLNPAQ